jgi:hypothetical protein
MAPCREPRRCRRFVGARGLASLISPLAERAQRHDWPTMLGHRRPPGTRGPVERSDAEGRFDLARAPGRPTRPAVGTSRHAWARRRRECSDAVGRTPGDGRPRGTRRPTGRSERSDAVRRHRPAVGDLTECVGPSGGASAATRLADTAAIGRHARQWTTTRNAWAGWAERAQRCGWPTRPALGDLMERVGFVGRSERSDAVADDARG